MANQAPRNGITVEPVERVADRNQVEGSVKRYVLGRGGDPADVGDPQTVRFALAELDRFHFFVNDDASAESPVSSTAVKARIRRALASPTLEVPCDVLGDLFETRSVTDADGQRRPVHGNVSATHANALYRTVRALRPRTVLEIGMAYGAASLAITQALYDVGEGGRLVSVDPNQTSQWKRIGVLNLERAGLSTHHELIERRDYTALPDLLAKGTTIQFAYIDGWHTFDYVLLDFFYVDKMLDAGGVVAFNDCALGGVHRATRFVRSHRRYQPYDAGLRASYVGPDVRSTLRRIATGRSKSDRYFRKDEAWEPQWDFYARF